MTSRSTQSADIDSTNIPVADTSSIDASASVKQTKIGRFCEIGARCHIAESSLGDYSYLSHDADVIYTEIGKFCSIASHVRINPGNHPLQRAALHHFTYRTKQYGLGEDDAAFFDWRRSQAVKIGNDVWIGYQAIILPGVTIGDGAVIGAGAVVSHDVADFTIAVGVPARPLRARFDESICAHLQRIAWWHWSHEQLHDALSDFRTLPIAAFCTKYDVAPASHD